jgi:phospholipase C
VNFLRISKAKSASSLLVAAMTLAAACGTTKTTGDSDDATTAGDGTDSDAVTLACGATPAADPLAADRDTCKFAVGAKVADSLGVTSADRAKLAIGHVIVVMKENRSFDNIFGRLGRSDVEAVPETASNPDKAGAAVDVYHEATTCVKLDPAHQWTNMHTMYDDGKLDGFVTNAIDNTTGPDDTTKATTDGRFVMGGFTPTELPFYAFLANTYALADHYHCSALAGTWANRLYLYAGQSYGVKNTGFNFVPDGTKTVFDALDTAGVTWGVYSDDDFPLDVALLNLGWNSTHAGVHPTADFYAALKAGTLPQVVFIDAKLNDEDEHPPADVQKGEAWTKKIYDAVVASSIWLDKDGKGVALVYTYDESGGFYDHVPPPKACAPDAAGAEFDHLGFRVPFVMISPFARQKYVSHAVHSHSSLLRFIEVLFDLPAMSNRDANADALLDMFDFNCAPLTTPPVAPATGTGGCKI